MENNKVPQPYPANTVFALMEDKEFRNPIIRQALEKDKTGVCRLTTGKNQLKGYRNLAKAPMSMLIPVISNDANISDELAEKILRFWLGDQTELEDKVAEKLRTLGYEPQTNIFDEEHKVHWNFLKKEHAEAQFEGTFIDGVDKNAVMLMSLLLGWFGSEEEEEEETKSEE